jgi:hypothetical protein
MSKGVLPIIAIATVSTNVFMSGSLAYFINRFFSPTKTILTRSTLIEVIVTLRKNIFSTLREIAYAANCIKILESGIEPRKIKDIFMDDGCTPP